MIRYALHDIASLRARFSLDDGLPKGIRPHYNIQPATQVPVVRRHDDKRIVTPMVWGLVPKGATATHSIFRYKTHLTPSEKLLSRHSWETMIRSSRCIVPANGYFTTTGQGDDRQAHYTRLSSDDIIGMAGIYTEWTDSDGTPRFFVSIITIDTPHPGEGSTPVLIAQDEEARWLDPSVTDSSDIYDMLCAAAPHTLTTHRVHPRMLSKKYNRPDAVAPLAL